MQDDPPEDDDLSGMLDSASTTALHLPERKLWKRLKRYGFFIIVFKKILLIIWLVRSGYLPLPW